MPSAVDAERCLVVLGIHEDLVLVTRRETQASEWKSRFSQKFQLSEFNGARMTLKEAIAQVQAEKTLSISFRKTDDGLARKLMLDIWETVPKTIAQDCIIGNSDVLIGFHDIFGVMSDAEEDASYIARSPFSVTFWGYRCPANFHAYREAVLALPVISEISEILASHLGQPVKVAVFMSL